MSDSERAHARGAGGDGMSPTHSARARGQLWVGNYARHYGGHQYREPEDYINAARDLIADCLDYVDALALEYHLPTDGAAQILEDLTRERSSSIS